LQNWADADGTGIAFDSSTAFELPNGAVRAPDAAWVGRERLARLSEEEKQRFLPLCPDFVAELRSPSDSFVTIRMKMREYIEQGARLGWLVDPVERQVYVYRPGVPIEILEAPVTVSGDPVLPGFELALTRIWSPGW
jgi:Uma2 family endonuclease